MRLHGRPFAVIMRTPGADRELAAGFLLAERVITGADDLGTIAHCTEPGADHPENIVNVTLANGSLPRRSTGCSPARRQVTHELVVRDVRPPHDRVAGGGRRAGVRGVERFRGHDRGAARAAARPAGGVR